MPGSQMRRLTITNLSPHRRRRWPAVRIALTLALWMRDSLVLNILMLLAPIEAIKRWQMGG